MNKEAFFTDETKNFRTPAEADAGQQVTFRFRTAKNDVDEVFFAERDGEPKGMRRGDSDALFDYYEYQMTVPDYPVNYYFLAVKDSEVCHYNRLGAGQDDRRQFDFCLAPGFFTPEWAKGAVMYQIFVDRFCRGDESNDVVDGEYIYVGGPVRHVKDWYAYPEISDVGRFYGGDLQGVRDKLDYIKGLGVDAIYFNPLFVSPSNHKYDTQDYDHIDPHYARIVKDGGEPVVCGDGGNDWRSGNSGESGDGGGNGSCGESGDGGGNRSCGESGDGGGNRSCKASGNSSATKYRIRTASEENLEASDRFFADFVREAHAKGLRVIIDGVFNHCGSFNKWLDRENIYGASGQYKPGAYASADSPYRTFFRFRKPDAWPDNSSYEGWWGYDTLPKLNYEESPQLCEYILQIARKWVSPPYNVDGWRLDVAADLGHSSAFNHKFWKDFRRVVKEGSPDALILAEHYGDPAPWLAGDEWDTVMNYDAFMEPLTWFLTGMDKHSDKYDPNLYGDGEAFFRSMFYCMSRMPMPSILTSMNELSNHDHSRFLTRTNRTPGRIAAKGPEAAERGVHREVFREAVLVQMTWPGAPTVYYGDEAGLCGWTDPDDRRTYPWGREDQEMIGFHRCVIGLHHKNSALRQGSLKKLAADRQLIAYGRFDADNRCVVVVNNSAAPRTVHIPVWQIGIEDGDRLTRAVVTDAKGYAAAVSADGCGMAIDIGYDAADNAISGCGMAGTAGDNAAVDAWPADYPVEGGCVEFLMGGNSAILLVSNKNP